MQINVIDGSPERYKIQQEELARKLRMLLMRIQALQELVRVEDDGDNGDNWNGAEARSEIELDVTLLRQGLRELEQMASEVFYEMQKASGGLLLEDLPGVALGEALSQLVEKTAESLTLSSRVTFSGWERPLSDYLSRLLYRIAQEALARVATHEGTRRLRFSMDYRRAEVVLTLEDDGVPGVGEQLLRGESSEVEALPPFLAATQPEKSATQQLADQTMARLRVMVENLGGSLASKSGIEQGVQVQVRMPVKRLERGEYGEAASVPVPAPTTSPETAETPAKIGILIVDGQTVARAGLRRLLEGYPDLEVIGEASDSVQAVSETAELLPQVVLLDAQLPGDQSLETLRQVRQLNTAIHVLLLANREDETLLYEALKAGAGGYLLKDIAPAELAQAVRGVARGEVLIQPQLAARLLARSGGSERGTGSLQESLTTREREVLQQLARGLRNKEIAARLFVSERTVNFHLANIYAKLRVSGRTEALSKALEYGLLRV